MALGRFAISYSSASGFGGGFGVLDAIKGKFGLRDPAGISLARAGIRKTLTSGRAQSYLRWLMRQPNKRKLRYLDKVLGLTQHRYRNQYPKHLQRQGRANSNP